MRFGCCIGVDSLEAVAQAGFDYAELPVGAVAPLEGPEQFEEARRQIAAAGIVPEGFFSFVPASVRLVGPEVDWDVVARYVRTACGRVSELGGRVIGFGSGQARRRPEDFPEAEARDQLVRFLRLAGNSAQAAGLQIAIEPLRRAEGNLVNSLPQAHDLARAVKHPAVHVLADLYHMAAEDESLEVLETVGGELIHVHLAEPPERTAPGVTGYDFRPFFRALVRAGYRGRVSVECRWRDLDRELPQALEVLRRHWADVAGQG